MLVAWQISKAVGVRCQIKETFHNPDHHAFVSSVHGYKCWNTLALRALFMELITWMVVAYWAMCLCDLSPTSWTGAIVSHKALCVHLTGTGHLNTVKAQLGEEHKDCFAMCSMFIHFVGDHVRKYFCFTTLVLCR